MKEPKRLLSHGATDFERQLLRAVVSERPSALLRSRMQRGLGLVGPLAWASNVKAMFGTTASKVTGGIAVGLVVAGGFAAVQLMPDSTDSNFLHSNPYPNTASPGQTRECEAGNERYADMIGRTIVGNQPGNQGTKTQDQPKAKASTP